MVMPDFTPTQTASRPNPAPSAPNPPLLWDVFCRVIDHHGDLGVCWRLACHLAARGQRVRLWVDKPDDLQWMAPSGPALVSVHPWPAPADHWPTCTGPTRTVSTDRKHPTADMPHRVIEAFGCHLPDGVQAALARMPAPPVWINLEYLSAEPHVSRLHGLPSPVMSGPASGLQKWFFYPGFTAHTGGLLHPTAPGPTDPPSSAFSSPPATALRVLLFCYEPASLPAWLDAWADGGARVDLSVCAGRASPAVAAWQCQRGTAGSGALHIRYLPWVSQAAFDDLLAQHDLNLVRGEDSLVRAIWAGKPLVWQIYPQSDGVHHAKLAAFLHSMNAPPGVVQAHLAWNADTAQAPPTWDAQTLRTAGEWVRATRQCLLAQPDLAQQLIDFALRHSSPAGAQR